MDTFTALGDPTRRQIVELLAETSPRPASEIYGQFAVSAPAISQHLKVLKEAGLVAMEKQGQRHLYSLNPDTMAEVELWFRFVQQRWNSRLTKLEKLIAEDKAQGGNKS